LALCVTLVAVGCRLKPWPLPEPATGPPPWSTKGVLFAGFGREDLTTGPGIGLAGNGPEGKVAAGWRTRLYARALYLQDSRDERLVLVATDLTHVSPLVHRLVGTAPCVQRLKLGVDRIVIFATHTHAAPAHFYEAAQLNTSSSSLPGFDSLVTTGLVHQIAAAICTAQASARPARIGWGSRAVWGYTRNRSYQPHRRNYPPSDWYPAPPPGLDPVEGAVNPWFTMLRVDQQDPATDAYHPAGAFSVFAIHGTANDPSNDLLDGDVHAVIERELSSSSIPR
jgi:neutral ceramidase